jgi:hypothetical protein
VIFLIAQRLIHRVNNGNLQSQQVACCSSDHRSFSAVGGGRATAVSLPPVRRRYEVISPESDPRKVVRSMMVIGQSSEARSSFVKHGRRRILNGSHTLRLRVQRDRAAAGDGMVGPPSSLVARPVGARWAVPRYRSLSQRRPHNAAA